MVLEGGAVVGACVVVGAPVVVVTRTVEEERVADVVDVVVGAADVVVDGTVVVVDGSSPGTIAVGAVVVVVSSFDELSSNKSQPRPRPMIAASNTAVIAGSSQARSRSSRMPTSSTGT